jgi:hypothetical protein
MERTWVFVVKMIIVALLYVYNSQSHDVTPVAICLVFWCSMNCSVKCSYASVWYMNRIKCYM